MLISSDFRMWQHRGDDHQKDVPNFIIFRVYTSYNLKLKSIPEVVATWSEAALLISSIFNASFTFFTSKIYVLMYFWAKIKNWILKKIDILNEKKLVLRLNNFWVVGS